MGKRYGTTLGSALHGNDAPIDLLSLIRGNVYFPTYSDGLKDIASWLGFAWSEQSPIGLNSVVHRHTWENSADPVIKANLLTYNTEDCQAAELVARALVGLQAPDPGNRLAGKSADTVSVETLRRKRSKFGPFMSPFKEFEQIALAAHWDYQRDRIRVRPTGSLKRVVRRQRERLGPRHRLRANKTIDHPTLSACPTCGGESIVRPNRCTACDTTSSSEIPR